VTVSFRKAIADYRTSPVERLSPDDPRAQLVETILNQLEANPEDKVSAAFQRLRRARSDSVLFYLIQAVDLAKSRHLVVRETAKKAEEFRRHARMARELVQFATGEIAIHLWKPLPEVADALDARAKSYDEAMRRLHINRKNAGEPAEQLLALRHFFWRLHSEHRIELEGRAGKKQREAACWLLEAALGCEIPATRVSEALRNFWLCDSQNRLESLKRKRRRTPGSG
jgi:hypothetical protein